jgi:hypothetical protein
MLLVDKGATSAASLITSRPTGGRKTQRAAAQAPRTGPMEWKIVERPPGMKFVPLTRDAFLALIMELADG